MSTKFAVPFLVFGLAVFGCSSSDTPNTGTGGRGGSSARGGAGGTAGSGGATGGSGGATGGATAGSGGGTAGSGGGTAGSGGGTAGSGGGTAGSGGATGGSGGGTAGSGGAAGARGGAGGATGGSGGATGGSGGGTAGSGGGAGTGANPDAGNPDGSGNASLGQAKSKCMSDTAYNTNNGTGVFTAAEFCALYVDTCADQSPPTAYQSETTCLVAWAAVMTAGGTQPHCRTYHLCNAQQQGMDAAHCPHATGMGGFCQ
jgi:hypothetical protein